jgi:AraC-like DNA-binding protein
MLLKASTFDERAALTTDFLMTSRREPDRRAQLLQAAVAAIEEADGNIGVNALARRLGTSASTLRRHFRVLGLPPKRFASIVRFRRSHAFLHTTPGATWADAVEKFGYADQAHLVRNYHRFAGTAPTRWNPRLRAIDRRMGLEDPLDDQD